MQKSTRRWKTKAFWVKKKILKKAKKNDHKKWRLRKLFRKINFGNIDLLQKANLKEFFLKADFNKKNFKL